MSIKTNEFFIECKWGKIACISCGDPKKTPVLLIHGYMDTAATFIPMLKHLPNTYYYVALDLPGHGKSDPFPVGPIITQAHQVYAVHQVINHLKWDTFMCMTHSIGFIIGVLYNYLYPFKMSKMVNLDPGPPISTYCAPYYIPHLWYNRSYGDYYKNYSRWEKDRTKEYTYEQAINLLMKNRKLNEEQSAILLSRTLIPVGDNKYRFSWEPTMKKVTAVPFTEEMLISIVTTNAPPMLNVAASEDHTLDYFKEKGVRLMKIFKESMKNFTVVNVDGPHDIHVIKPEVFVDKIIDFLNSDVENVVLAKL